MSDRPDELEALAARLEASGDYRVLRRLRHADRVDRARLPEGAREAVVLDLETTGLDPANDVPIEIAMVRFAYSPGDGRVHGVTGELRALEDPGRPLPPEVVALTGLTDADLAGQRFPDDAIAAFVEGAGLVIAHNAAFDRPFAEQRWALFTDLPWACTWREVPWRDGEGFESSGLKAILSDYGVFFEGHRALEDVYAVVDLLGRTLPSDGAGVLQRLRGSALAVAVRVWAVNSPFESKDLLKARGYRWNADAKTWWTDVPEAALADERAFLAREVYGRRPMPTLPTLRVDAKLRYSKRVPEAPPG